MDKDLRKIIRKWIDLIFSQCNTYDEIDKEYRNIVNLSTKAKVKYECKIRRSKNE